MTILGSVGVLMLTLGAPAEDVRSVSAPVVGDRVRWRDATNRRRVGSVVTVEADALVVKLRESEQPMRIKYDAMRWLAVFRGRTSQSGKGATVGLVMGGLVGLGVRLLAADPDCEGHCPGAVTNISFIAAFGLTGAALGSLIGSGLAAEKWELVRGVKPELKVTGTLGGGRGRRPGVSVGLSLRW
jgi:hypothetical protein